MADDVRNHVIRSLRRRTGLADADIQGRSELVGGLGLDGDDAAEFFEELRKRFGTDLSVLEKDWARYFQPEPTLLSIFTFRRRRTLIPITVEEVVRAVERGVW
jgi:hypothetical protein